MPRETWDRRGFLKRAGLAAFGVALGSCKRLEESKDPLINGKNILRTNIEAALLRELERQTGGGRIVSLKDIQAEDLKSRSNVVHFSFLQTEGNQHFVVFWNKELPIVREYRTYLTEDENGRFYSDYAIEKNGSFVPFLSFKFAEGVINKNDPNLQAEVERTMKNPRNISLVTLSDPYTGEQVNYSLNNGGGENSFTGLSGLFPLGMVVEAQALEPTETKVVTPTSTLTATPTRTRTVIPTVTATPTEKVKPTRTPTPTDRPTQTEAPKPTETRIPPTVQSETPGQSERGRLPVNPQAYSLSCEMASSEISVLWYNSVHPDRTVGIPQGFKTFEDYFIDRVGVAGNPIDGFCGKVNGGLSTSCDRPGLGYGVYPHPMIKGFQELGVPVEMFVFKDASTSREELRNILVESYNNNQAMLFWERTKSTPAVEFRQYPQTGEMFPMALGEHCVAGQVIKIDGDDILIEISDPLPYGRGSRYVLKFETLFSWMSNMGWIMSLRIG